MQDPRVQAAFPGGVMWLRAGRAAAGRLPRMMELAVCQVGKRACACVLCVFVCVRRALVVWKALVLRVMQLSGREVCAYVQYV